MIFAGLALPISHIHVAKCQKHSHAAKSMKRIWFILATVAKTFSF